MTKSKTIKEKPVKQKTDYAHIAMRFVLLSIVFTSYMVLMDAFVGEPKWANVALTAPQVIYAAYLLGRK